MSVDPHWFSTIFGIPYFSGGLMSFLAFTILLSKWLNSRGYYKEAINTEHYHDLGKLMFSFMIFWTYTNFSQYMLIWYANLPEETGWFSHRAVHGWGAIGTVLIIGHFLFPFVFLLSRNVKRHKLGLPIGAAAMLIVHCIDMQFLILPSGMHGHGEGEGGDGGSMAAVADRKQKSFVAHHSSRISAAVVYSDAAHINLMILRDAVSLGGCIIREHIVRDHRCWNLTSCMLGLL